MARKKSNKTLAAQNPPDADACKDVVELWLRMAAEADKDRLVNLVTEYEATRRSNLGAASELLDTITMLIAVASCLRTGARFEEQAARAPKRRAEGHVRKPGTRAKPSRAGRKRRGVKVSPQPRKQATQGTQ